MNKSKGPESASTAAELSSDDQILIALREVVRRGGQAQMSEIYEAVEEEFGQSPLSHTMKASLRRVVSLNAVEAGYLYRRDVQNPSWRITPEGREFLESSSGKSSERDGVETLRKEGRPVAILEDLEVNYDQEGNPKTVVVPYADYKELVLTQEKNEALRRRLRRIRDIVTEALGAEERALDVGTRTDQVGETEEASYWITPVKSVPGESARECIRRLIGQERIYAFGDRTPGRKHIKPGDWICFYASGRVGVIGHARVASYPEEDAHSAVRQPGEYPWVFDVTDPGLYLSHPTVIDADLRAMLDAFEDKDPTDQWAWFVQGTHEVSRHDFLLLTQQSGEGA